MNNSDTIDADDQKHIEQFKKHFAKYLASRAAIPLETLQEREDRIRADVFNPNESDIEYFLRRKRELGM